MGQEIAAIQEYDKIIEIDPYNVDAYENKATILEHLGETSELDKCFKMIRKIKQGTFNEGNEHEQTVIEDEALSINLADIDWGQHEQNGEEDQELSITSEKKTRESLLIKQQPLLELFKAKHGTTKLNQLINLSDDLDHENFQYDLREALTNDDPLKGLEKLMGLDSDTLSI